MGAMIFLFASLARARTNIGGEERDPGRLGRGAKMQQKLIMNGQTAGEKQMETDRKRNIGEYKYSNTFHSN